jgi:hypothetical protein
VPPSGSAAGVRTEPASGEGEALVLADHDGRRAAQVRAGPMLTEDDRPAMAALICQGAHQARGVQGMRLGVHEYDFGSSASDSLRASDASSASPRMATSGSIDMRPLAPAAPPTEHRSAARRSSPELQLSSGEPPAQIGQSTEHRHIDLFARLFQSPCSSAARTGECGRRNRHSNRRPMRLAMRLMAEVSRGQAPTGQIGELS